MSGFCRRREIDQGPRPIVGNPLDSLPRIGFTTGMDETTRVAGTVASPSEIRSHFPALERRHGGFPVAYFDGPGGTQVPRHVADAVCDYLLHHNANTHWAYPTSAETDAALAGARGALADFLNAEPDEIAFGANMTTLTFHLARALGREWGPGDEVVVTELDHHANVAPWQRLAIERGVTVRTVRMLPETGQLDWAHFEETVTPRTRLVAVGAASNALGTISDIPRAVRLAHDAGALAFVDAVHYAPHELVDVRALGCDFLCCSAYKFYGPHVGVMFGRRDRFAKVDFPKLIPAPDTPPEMAETGTLNHEGIVGAGAAVDFLASLAEGPTRRAAAGGGFRRVPRARHRAGAAVVAGAGGHRHGAPVRPHARPAAHAHRVLRRARRAVRRGRAPPCRPRAVPVTRRLLRQDRHRAPRPGTRGHRPRRLRMLRDRRGSGPTR